MIFCMHTQTSIRSHIGYVRLITNLIGGHYRSHKVKSWFSKEVEKYFHKCFFNRSLKNTALKGISPHCYKKDYHSLFPTVWISIFFYLFWKPVFDLVWPIMASNVIGNQTSIPYMTYYGCLSIHARKNMFGWCC